MEKIIFQSEYFDFCEKFYQDVELMAQGMGHREFQRFGQAFCNEFNITDPEIFYGTDIKHVINLIWDRYIRS